VVTFIIIIIVIIIVLVMRMGILIPLVPTLFILLLRSLFPLLFTV
jgi:hypothetical protein